MSDQRTFEVELTEYDYKVFDWIVKAAISSIGVSAGKEKGMPKDISVELIHVIDYLHQKVTDAASEVIPRAVDDKPPNLPMEDEEE